MSQIKEKQQEKVSTTDIVYNTSHILFISPHPILHILCFLSAVHEPDQGEAAGEGFYH